MVKSLETEKRVAKTSPSDYFNLWYDFTAQREWEMHTGKSYRKQYLSETKDPIKDAKWQIEMGEKYLPLIVPKEIYESVSHKSGKSSINAVDKV